MFQWLNNWLKWQFQEANRPRFVAVGSGVGNVGSGINSRIIPILLQLDVVSQLNASWCMSSQVTSSLCKSNLLFCIWSIGGLKQGLKEVSVYCKVGLGLSEVVWCQQWYQLLYYGWWWCYCKQVPVVDRDVLPWISLFTIGKTVLWRIDYHGYHCNFIPCPQNSTTQWANCCNTITLHQRLQLLLPT
jgi:hypothetical protein